ncbi:unnamed protein product [Mytilus coruscus]|uniref:Reverse transcriptase/retrotransposon-derived protein RNase H-like domain-containing protein n=1 Tax=Mytilus coruscus TaxID=42192 RepID=A0A6J8DI63_MYTCO|nr:unnamed protein product [Mytilus coruscus]
MERQGIIRKSTSPWGSPLCLVLKKSTGNTIKVRPTIDFRSVNKLCQDDAFPLPRIQYCLNTIAGSTLFTCVDLLSGYHQVPVKESDIPKTAFVTKYGLYEFTRMPMGLKSSAQTFQRLMELVVQGLPWSICLIYLDDIASPMINLTKKSENFVWSPECQESFEKIKDLLMTALIVAYPVDHVGYILDTDACETGIGAGLSQVQEDQEKVIAYGSRTLNKAKRNYCDTDKELLALRYFIEYYRQYLLGRKFSVRVDHQPPGKKHGNAYGLSRCPQEQCSCSESDTLESLKCGPCNKCIKRSREMESTLIENNPKFIVLVRAFTRGETASLEKKYWTKWKEKYSPCKLSQLQEDDTDIYPILDGLRKNEKPTDLTLSSPATRHYFDLWDSLTLLNNVSEQWLCSTHSVIDPIPFNTRGANVSS